jgi:hypothetical protein
MAREPEKSARGTGKPKTEAPAGVKSGGIDESADAKSGSSDERSPRYEERSRRYDETPFRSQSQYADDRDYRRNDDNGGAATSAAGMAAGPAIRKAIQKARVTAGRTGADETRRRV